MNLTKSLAQTGVLYFLVAACGEVGGSPDDAHETLSDADLAAAHASVEQVAQALGEATCANTSADATLTPSSDTSSARSPDERYDHPTCRNGYVVDLVGYKAGSTVRAATSWGPVSGLDGLYCLFTWSYAGLWRKDGANYVKVTEGDAWGAVINGKPSTFCSAQQTFTLPSDGDYKVVTGGGIWDLLTLPVVVSSYAPRP